MIIKYVRGWSIFGGPTKKLSAKAPRGHKKMRIRGVLKKGVGIKKFSAEGGQRK